MVRKRLVQHLMAIVTALWLSLVPTIAAATPGQALAQPRVTASAAILMDWQTGEILYERNSRQRRDPASTTKVLTAIIVLEKVSKLDAPVTVSKKAAHTVGSRMYIKPGEVYSVHDLLHGLLLRSGNDAAVALAEHVAGSVEEFARLMNETSLRLGARGSQWNNPHGLTHPRHYSTAYDLAVITRHALNNPTFASIVALRERPLTYEHLQRDVVLHNTNRLLFELEGVDGVKTGTTASAGACLIASATRDEQKLISVVLDAGNRWNQSATLLSWGFDNHRLVYLGRKGEVLLHSPVEDGKYRTVPLALAGDLLAVIRKGGEQPQLQVRRRPNMEAPIKKGQRLAEVDVIQDGQIKRTVPLEAERAIAERTLIDLIYQGVTPLLRFLSETGMF